MPPSLKLCTLLMCCGLHSYRGLLSAELRVANGALLLSLQIVRALEHLHSKLSVIHRGERSVGFM